MSRFSRRLVLISCAVLCVSLFHAATGLQAAQKARQVSGLVVVGLYPELAADLGLGAEQRGVVVAGVRQGAPAAAAGVRDGDLVVRVQPAGGKAVPVADGESFESALDRISASKPVVLIVLRGGQEVPIQFVRTTDNSGAPVQPESSGQPRVITVAGKSGDCRSIDGAMLKARPGDTIAVAAGRYPAISVTRNRVTLASQDPKDRAVVAGVTLTGVSGATLKDLDVVSASAGVGGGIVGTANQATITGCAVKRFAFGIDLGGQELNVDGNTFNENGWAIRGSDANSTWKIRHNLIAKNTGGVSVAGNVEISGNTIIENRVSSEEFLKTIYKTSLATGVGTIPGVGILVYAPGSRALVFNNILASNTIGALLDPGVQVTFEYNAVYMHHLGPATLKTGWALNDNHADLPATNSNILSQIKMSTTKVGGNFITTVEPVLSFQPSPTNISADPLFADPVTGDYRLSADSPLVGRGRGKQDIGAFPSVAAAEGAAGRDGRSAGSEPPAFGIAARPLTEADRQALTLSSLDGLWVTDVKKGSPADAMQLKVDDIIVAVNNAAFTDADQFKKMIASKVESLTVLRNGKKMTLVKSIVF